MEEKVNEIIKALQGLSISAAKEILTIVGYKLDDNSVITLKEKK